MKTLYIECKMGAAGDMLTAALLELLPDPQEFLEKYNTIGVPHVKMKVQSVAKCGICGTHVHMMVDGVEESEHHAHEHHEHEHPHEHDHHHDHRHHEHRSLQDIADMIGGLQVSDQVKSQALSVYKQIAKAESHAHGCEVSEIHFHEVGAMDAVADVTAVCMLLEELAPEKIIVSPVCVGSGTVKCAHGILPVPAPATAYLLQKVPTYSGTIESELCTPTGAALLTQFADSFGPMPVMTVEKIGYGMGRKNFETANCVRVFLGETQEASDTETLIELSCNLDDMSAEEIGFAMERLFEAGARDVYTTPIGMKKNRPGTMLTVLCMEKEREEMIRLFFLHTTTLGVREACFTRYKLARREETKETDLGPVRVKISEGYGVTRTKFEYEDLAKIAREQGLSLRQIRQIIEQ